MLVIRDVWWVCYLVNFPAWGLGVWLLRYFSCVAVGVNYC